MQLTRLEQLLADLGSTRSSPRQSGERMCAACVELLAVDGAGILLADAGGQVSSFGGSDDVVQRLEDLQFTLGEGPGVAAHRTGRLVWESDLGPASTRWSAFGPAAVEAGIGAVFAIPLRVGGVGLGALDLYQRRTGPLDTEQLEDAMVLVSVTVEMLLSLQAGDAFGFAPGSLDGAGSRRAHVHQAAGMISEQLDIPIGDALVRLRARAYAGQRPIDGIARDLIDRSLRMDEPPEGGE